MKFVLSIITSLLVTSALSSNQNITTKTKEKLAILDGFSLIYNERFLDESCAGSVYNYNRLSLNLSVYSRYYEESDTKFYQVVTENILTTNPNSIDHGFFRMVSREMKISISANDDQLSLVRYAPEVYPVKYIVFSDGTKIETTDSEKVVMTPNSDEKSVSFDYKFLKAYVKRNNNQFPYRGSFIQTCTAIYECDNYSSTIKDSDISFQIESYGTTQKYSVGWFTCWGHEIKISNHNHLVTIKA